MHTVNWSNGKWKHLPKVLTPQHRIRTRILVVESPSSTPEPLRSNVTGEDRSGKSGRMEQQQKVGGVEDCWWRTQWEKSEERKEKMKKRWRQDGGNHGQPHRGWRQEQQEEDNKSRESDCFRPPQPSKATAISLRPSSQQQLPAIKDLYSDPNGGISQWMWLQGHICRLAAGAWSHDTAELCIAWLDLLWQSTTACHNHVSIVTCEFYSALLSVPNLSIFLYTTLTERFLV